jgi:hypothetical protein
MSKIGLFVASAIALLGADRSVFAGTTTITFNGIAAPGSFVGYGSGPLTLSGATFTTNDQMFVIDPGFYGSSYPGGGFLNFDYSSPDILTVTLPANVHSVSFDFGGLFSPQTGLVAINGGAAIPISSPNSITGTNALDFFSFSSGTPISTVTLTTPANGEHNAVDNFSYTTVPEASTWMMLIVGFATLGFVGCRVRRGAAVAAA